MEQALLIALDGHDRVGLIADIAGRLFDIGGDLDETDFSSVGGRARWSGLCLLPPSVTPDDVRSTLLAVDGVIPDSIAVTRAGEAAPGQLATHILICEGPDRPGVVARLCEALIDYSGNVVRLTSRRRLRLPTDHSNALYRIECLVHLPDSRAAAALSALANTAAQMDQHLTASDVPMETD